MWLYANSVSNPRQLSVQVGHVRSLHLAVMSLLSVLILSQGFVTLQTCFQLHKVFVFLCERVHNGLRCGSGGGGGGDEAQTGTASKSIGGRRRGSFSVLEQAAGEVDGVTLSRSPHQLYTLLTISCDTLSYTHG